MKPDRLAYTAFIAFSSAILTLVAVHHLVPASSAAVPDERTITGEELAQHNHAESCWKAIDGQVYDVTDYIPDHPTSEEVMLEWCGRESSEAWHNKRPGRPHSPAAAAMLQHYLVGRLEPAATPVSATLQAAPAPAPAAGVHTMHPEGKILLGLAPGTWLDGRYRGGFYDRGEIQVNLQFEIIDGHIHAIEFRHLTYRGIDYLRLDEGDELYPVWLQHAQIIERLEGRPLSEIFALYRPAELVDDIDGFTSATLRGSKLISAIRDGLNRGVYQWR